MFGVRSDKWSKSFLPLDPMVKDFPAANLTLKPDKFIQIPKIITSLSPGGRGLVEERGRGGGNGFNVIIVNRISLVLMLDFHIMFVYTAITYIIFDYFLISYTSGLSSTSFTGVCFLLGLFRLGLVVPCHSVKPPSGT